MTIFKPGENCWKIARAEFCDVLIDAENYFRAVRREMAQAKQRIMLIGWDFDARVKMFDTQGVIEGPLEIGEYIEWLIERTPDLHIYILQWNLGVLKMLGRGRTLLKMVRWIFHPRIHLKLDSAHPVGAAQHEKVIVIDRSAAFCGGIDITEGRWDTRAHRDDEEKRKQPNGTDSGPWHDVSTVSRGEIADRFAELAEQRWQTSAGNAPIAARAQSLSETPAESDTQFVNVDIAIARTRGECDDQSEVREIEQVYCDIIASARNYIYIESQYFTSRKIGIALGERLEAKVGPEVVLILPLSVEGWLESQKMDSSRARLIEALRGRDRRKAFRVMHPQTGSGTAIYVHAKVFIVDDRFMCVGSANLSNRSMGFDAECNICIDAENSERMNQTRATIASIRNDLLSEHLGRSAQELRKFFENESSLARAIEHFDSAGAHLRPYETPDLNAVQHWLAENDILDPQENDEDYTPIDL